MSKIAIVLFLIACPLLALSISNLQATSIADTSPLNPQDKPCEFVPYDDPPRPLEPISPVYPDSSRAAGIQGTVVLEAEIFADGTVGEIKVRRSIQGGPGGLDAAAVEAVRKVRFEPGRSDGKPISTFVIIPIEFRLN